VTAERLSEVFEDLERSRGAVESTLQQRLTFFRRRLETQASDVSALVTSRHAEEPLLLSPTPRVERSRS
jgi:hypothetical protein